MNKNHFALINIKEGNPTTAVALDILKNSINRCKQNKTHCLVIIHGYGSHDVGGAICKRSRQWLEAQVRNGKIKCVIFGEDFNVFNENVRQLIINYDGFDEYLRVYNHGITVIVF